MTRRLRAFIPFSIILLSVLLCGYLNIIALHVNGSGARAESRAAVQDTEQDTEQATTVQATEHSVKAHPNSEVSYDQYAFLLNADGFYDTGDSGYVLTKKERKLVECAVTCEAGGEGLRGEMMVAQSILDGSLRHEFTVSEEIAAYSVATTSYSKVTDEVREAVSRVFDQGERVTMEKTDLWYNPSMVVSLWHEEQQYVITVGSHRFFWMNDDL